MRIPVAATIPLLIHTTRIPPLLEEAVVVGHIVHNLLKELARHTEASAEVARSIDWRRGKVIVIEEGVVLGALSVDVRGLAWLGAPPVGRRLWLAEEDLLDDHVVDTAAVTAAADMAGAWS